ncbi:MAG: glycosyltransferase family 39 protein, partial [Vicinamibacterales bacterium]
MRFSRRTTIGALLGLTALAAILRGIGLDAGLWFDEILTLVLFARPPLEHIVTEYSSSNNHPLYSVLAHLAIGLFGEHAWSLRLPAFLFGVAAVPAVYALGRAVTDRREALLASALLTVSYHHIWFSQNARGYTALALWAMVGTWLLLKGWQSGRPAFFIGYGVISALGIYTHLTMAFMVIGHALVVVVAWASRPRDRWIVPLAFGGFAVAAVCALVLYTPMAVDVYAFFTGPSLETAAVATPSWALRETVRGLQIGLGALGAVAAAVLFVAGLSSYWREDPFVTGIFVAPGLVTGAAILALQSPVRPRFFFFLAGFAVLLVIRGATVIAGAVVRAFPRIETAHHRFATALVALIIAASSASLPYGYRYPKQDYEGAMRFVDSIATPEVPVLTAGLAVYPYREYYRRSWRPLDTAGDLRAVLLAGQEIVVVYTFPEYTDAALMRTVVDECRPLRVFPATVAGGDIVV